MRSLVGRERGLGYRRSAWELISPPRQAAFPRRAGEGDGIRTYDGSRQECYEINCSNCESPVSSGTSATSAKRSAYSRSCLAASLRSSQKSQRSDHTCSSKSGFCRSHFRSRGCHLVSSGRNTRFSIEIAKYPKDISTPLLGRATDGPCCLNIALVVLNREWSDVRASRIEPSCGE